MDKYSWHQSIVDIQGISYNCGYCGNLVGPSKGYRANVRYLGAIADDIAHIYICPRCGRPTFLAGEDQVPNVRLGRDVNGISDIGVQSLYNEARDCTSVGAFTAAVLLCRKLLMNIAVQHEADEGLTFIKYIEYLDQSGYVPPNGKAWVDQIRQKGNEATHEIKVMTAQEANQIMQFTEMLLRFVYEFPSMLDLNP